MVVASIDIQNGKVVQLRGGEELVLERGDAASLAKEFNLYGKTAVIDIDAAKGRGSNTEILKPLLSIAECRVGGGVRSVEKAVELISLGAEKVIVGSAAFCKNSAGVYEVNAPFLSELSLKIGRERLILAVDSREGVITASGWQVSTGLDLVETAKALSPYAGEFLWTCVEREGSMTGIDFEALKALKNSVGAQITAAGGVSSLSEIEKIAALGCDVQLGMALYTGKVNLADAFIASLNWEKGAESGGKRLLPVIAQSGCGQVLMTGFTDREALGESFKRGNLCFYSRSRARLWMKGESSGNVLKIEKLRADCDRDAILAVVSPAGPVCHTGAFSCFETARRFTFEYLREIIDERLKTAPAGSYTASLTTEKVKRKIMEEAYELCTASERAGTVWEAADLFFHIVLLLSKEGVGIDEVLRELERRHLEDHAKKKRYG